MTKRLYTMLMLPLLLDGVSLRSLRREDGQTLAEYALILALVALAVVVAVGFLSGKIQHLFSSIGSQL